MIGRFTKKLLDSISFYYPQIDLYRRLRLRIHETYDALRAPAARPISLPSLIDKFEAESSGIQDLKSAIDFTFSWNYESVDLRPYQVRSEITRFLDFAKRLSAKTVVEIGTAKGGTLFLLTRIAHPDALIVSLDSRHGHDFNRTNEALFRLFPRGKQVLHLIRGNSHSPRTLRELQSVLNGAKIDLIFIDGDHTYSGVRRDFINILPLMARNGAMAFHDISAIKVDYHMIEVSRFWAEVKRCYRHHEFVDREAPLGIGVLLV